MLPNFDLLSGTRSTQRHDLNTYKEHFRQATCREILLSKPRCGAANCKLALARLLRSFTFGSTQHRGLN